MDTRLTGPQDSPRCIVTRNICHSLLGQRGVLRFHEVSRVPFVHLVTSFDSGLAFLEPVQVPTLNNYDHQSGEYPLQGLE